MKFDTVDYTQWIEKVKKELKLEALDEKHLTLLDGQSFDPFFKRTQHETFQFTRSEYSWLIGEIVDVSNTNNKKIHQMLEGGAQKLHLIHATSETDYNQLFEGVFLSMIQLHLETEDEQTAHHFWEFISSSNTDSRENHSCSIGVINQGLKKTISIGHHPDSLVSFCIEVISYIKNHANHSWESIVDSLNILVTVQPKGIMHIAFVDAVRELWALICKSFGEETRTPHIEQVVKYDNSLSIDENFISASVQAVNAVIATSDVLYIENAQDNNDFSRTINRNMQHLLQLESFMNQAAFAYKGSYTIEKMSEMLVKNTWDKIGVTST